MNSRKIATAASNHKKDKLSWAIRLRQKNRPKESLALLLDLVGHHPHDPQINYQCAWAHDVLGREKEAIPFYEKAIRRGLKGKDLEGALIGLGSSYRYLGQYEKAIKTLRRATAKFPGNGAAQVFLAMSLYNEGQHGQAIELLLKNLAETSSNPSIASYKRAILFYADKMGDIQRT